MNEAMENGNCKGCIENLQAQIDEIKIANEKKLNEHTEELKELSDITRELKLLTNLQAKQLQVSTNLLTQLEKHLNILDNRIQTKEIVKKAEDEISAMVENRKREKVTNFIYPFLAIVAGAIVWQVVSKIIAISFH